MREFHRVGPPGTGKSTSLMHDVEAAILKYGSNRVMGVSFTKGAAVELTRKAEERGVPIDRSMFGTLHALAYRALGSPPIADTPEGVKKWNQYCIEHNRGLDQLDEGGNGADLDEPGWDAGTGSESPGTEHYNNVQLWRAQMLPQAAWLPMSLGWFQRWEAWKKAEGMIDFTDMIELALTQTDMAPGHPSVIFADEVQDFSKLEQALLRHWGAQCETLVLAGDPDQAIMIFKGADPRIFLDTTPDFRSVLAQSFRVPRQVHAWAERWIRGSHGQRLEREYLPRDAEGEVRMTDAVWKYPESILWAIEPYLKQENDQGQPMTVMIQASCSYMLDPIKRELRARGLPFHNPYRTRRGDWNPIRTNAKGTSSVQRLLAYLRPRGDIFGEQARMWTADDLQQWLEPLEAKGLLSVQKSKLNTLPVGRELSIEEIMAVLGENVLEAVEADPAWFAKHLLGSKAKTYEFPLAVARRDPQALRRRPQILLGTAHSFKGAEADVTLLFPDLSMAGYQEWQGDREQHDSVRRLFYVGATRARQVLLLGAPSGYAVEW